MKIWMQCCAALALVAGLAGCAGGSPANGESSPSGITVFGDIDVGVGRVR